ncbi:MAG TPA: 2OG-Fe(II) oxygenase, partial [Paraburkholderia sp.]
MSMHAENEVVEPVAADRSPAPSSAMPATSAPNADRLVASRTHAFDNPRLRKDFADQDAFLYLEDFLAPEVTAQLVHSARTLLDEVNRNYLPGH